MKLKLIMVIQKISNSNIFEDFMNIMKKKDLDFDLYYATE